MFFQVVIPYSHFRLLFKNESYIIFSGDTVYSWEGDKREMVARLDVGKLLPSREQQESLLTKTLHLTALHSSEEFVVVGTSTGFVFLLAVDGLHHLFVFHPFSKDVRSFCILTQVPTIPTKDDLSEASAVTQTVAPTRLVAFGKNYSHLFDSKGQEQRRAYALLYALTNHVS